MANNGSIVARSAGESTTVTNLLLNVADNGTFGELAYGKDITDSESSLLTAVDEGTSMKALSSDESFTTELVAVGVPEDNAGKRSTTVYKDMLDAP